MSIEVLVACMNQENMSIINKLNIQSNALIINQCGNNAYKEEDRNSHKYRMYSSMQRGLTKSRNLALANAVGEICVLCDDDVQYTNDYKEKILKAFKELPEADIIIFNIERTNYDRYIRPIKKIRRAPIFKAYGSVRIAFRLSSFQKKNIWFNLNFGSGSIYSSGEESLLLREAHMKKLKIYEYPATIATVDFSDSTWRDGFTEKFFYDKGALLAAAYPFMKYIFMLYYLILLKNSTQLSTTAMLKNLIYGIRGYKYLISYNEYKSKNG